MNQTAIPTHLTSFLILSLALITSACGSSMKNPDIKQNPHPRMRYEITMIIDDAPGSFDSVAAFAGYDIANDRCVPLTPGSGATLAPKMSVPLTLTHVSENVYKATVYADLLQDEDYYGRGVCRWKMTAVTSNLQLKKTTITADISLEDVISQKSTARYFSNQNFTDLKLSGVDIGNAERSDFKDSSDTFSVTFTVKENFQ